MRKSVVAGIVVVVAAAAFVALFFLLDHRDEEAPLRLRSEAEAAGGVAPVPAQPGIGDSPASRAIAAIRPSPYVEEETPETRTLADDDVLRVLVVEEATGLPVPEAEVAWTDGQAEAGLRRGPYSMPATVVSDFDHAPQRAMADARGIALIRTSERLVVAARSGARFGSRKFQKAPRGEIRVVIQPGVFVAARVVTTDGNPVAGVPILLTVTRTRGKSTESQTFGALTRGDGVAVADHAPTRPEDANAKVEVSANLQGAPPKEAVKAPFEKLKEGPIAVVIGSVGRVFVKLLDTEGKLFTGEARVSLFVSRTAKAVASELRAAAFAGTASFSSVPVGAALSVSADSESLDSIRSQKVGQLAFAGEDLTVEARFGRPRAMIVGRALDEAGHALSGTSIQVEAVGPGGVLVLPSTASVTTDGTGGFKLALDRQFFRDGACDLELEVRSGRDRIDRHGTVSVAKPSESEDTHVGDVRLARPEPLASGVVEDELGAPVAGAVVVTEALRLPPARSVTIGSRDVPLFQRLRATTDEAGAFEIPLTLRQRERPRSFSLRAEAEGYRSSDLVDALQPGTKNVKLMVRGSGVIQGRLLLPDPAPVRRLDILLRRPGATNAPVSQRFEDCVDSNGVFRLPNILPGVVTLVIRRTPSIELVEIPDVSVPRLAATDDPRLQAIDLREHAALRP